MFLPNQHLCAARIPEEPEMRFSIWRDWKTGCAGFALQIRYGIAAHLAGSLLEPLHNVSYIVQLARRYLRQPNDLVRLIYVPDFENLDAIFGLGRPDINVVIRRAHVHTAQRRNCQKYYYSQ